MEIEKEAEAIGQKPLEEIQGKEFLSISEACALLGISRQTLHRAIKRGVIQTTKLGRRLIIKRASIDKLFE